MQSFLTYSLDSAPPPQKNTHQRKKLRISAPVQSLASPKARPRVKRLQSTILSSSKEISEDNISDLLSSPLIPPQPRKIKINCPKDKAAKRIREHVGQTLQFNMQQAQLFCNSCGVVGFPYYSNIKYNYRKYSS